VLNLNILNSGLTLTLVILSLSLLMQMANANELTRDIVSLNANEKMTSNPKNDDLLLVQRIVKAYQHVASSAENRGKSMWQDMYNQRHVPIHNIFKNGNIDAAAAILRDPSQSDLFYGIDNLSLSIQPSIVQYTHAHAVICLDGLVRFAEAIGAVGYAQPSEPWKAELVIDKIEKALGQPLTFPNPYPNEWGLWTPRGIVSYRVPQALYQAWKIKQLVKDIEKPRVLEIGAGLGRTAYFARLLGVEDYTIVDLPFTALSSGYFLGTSLGQDQVLLSGETVNQQEKLVKIISPDEYFASDRKYDLIVNVDSLTEMDPVIALAYWKKIESNGGIFLSINHENNPFTVQSIIEKSPRVEQYDKKPYWMRKLYFEELARLKP
jgi:hypothetical protein